MNHIVLTIAFLVGLVSIAWVGVGFSGASLLALGMTALIAAAYLAGGAELRRFRSETQSLQKALRALGEGTTPLSSPADLGAWLATLPAALQAAVRQRIEGQATPLPGLALTPYLVGLLVMLGMLGTFGGMVHTFQGAVFALEGSTDLQAMRAALAAPIKGLGLAFGTSVAGVAGSAMLGLLAAIVRRERVAAVRLLDALIATELRAFSPAHRRERAEEALQQQAQALPAVVSGLQALIERLDQRSEQQQAALSQQQAKFHREAGASYQALAQSVERSLQDSLSASARAASDTLRPALEQAVAGIAAETRRLHAQVGEQVQAQLDGLSTRLSATSEGIAQGWQAALAQQAQAQDALVQRLDGALNGAAEALQARATQWLAQAEQASAAHREQQAQAEQARQQALTTALASLSHEQQAAWQRVSDEALARQQALGQALQDNTRAVAEQAREQAAHTLQQITTLLASAEALATERVQAETRWIATQDERLSAMTQQWQQGLSALRDDEAQRAEAALARLDGLQAAVAQHLATLGTALEAPLNRLLQTAAEVPEAAADVIAQLRREMGQVAERDNLALQERAELMAQIQALLAQLAQTTEAQRGAIEQLVSSASATLQSTSEHLGATLQAQASHTQEAAAQVAGSAVELAALGDAFAQGVQGFGESSQQLIEQLGRIEAALQQSMARSDEQLAYYVGQAREVIDLSIGAQQGILDDLRRLQQRGLGDAQGAGA